MQLTEEKVDRNRKTHSGFCRSLKIQAEALKIPLELIAVGGNALLASMGQALLGSMDIWVEGNMWYRFAERFGKGKNCVREGEFMIHFWTPYGTIFAHSGHWLRSGVDFSGLKDTIEINGLLHWDAGKSCQWYMAQESI